MNKLFSKGIYRDMLRQIRLMCLIFLAICLAASVLSLISSYASMIAYEKMDNGIEYVPYETVDNVAPILSLFMYAGGIVIPFAAFQYLNKRSNSDFYHSIPVTRTGLFTGTLLACLTWMAIIIVSTVAVTVLGCLILKINFYYNFVPYVLLSYLFGTFLVAATASLAMSATGTRFSNIVLFGLIFLLPRIVLILCSMGISDVSLNTIPIGESVFFLDETYNFPFGLLSKSMSFYDESLSATITKMFYSFGTMAYTFGIGIVYTVLACFAFNRRKSETAGNSALSKFWQHVYRCAVSFLPLFILGILLIGGNSEMGTNITLVVLSIFAYFLFELITTKSFKKMLKSAPVYLVVVALTVLLCFGLKTYATAKSTVVFDINEVKSICVGSFENSYNRSLASDVEITDNIALQMAVDAREKDAKVFRGEAQHGDIITARVVYNLDNGSSVERNVMFDASVYPDFFDRVENDPNYSKAMRALPTDDEINSISASSELTTEQEWDIWRTYRAEIENADINRADYFDRSMPALNITIIIDGVRYYEQYPIIAEYSPKTLDKFIQYVNEGMTAETVNEGLEKFVDVAKRCVGAANEVDYMAYMQANLNLSLMSIRNKNGEKVTYTANAFFDVYSIQGKGVIDVSWLDEVKTILSSGTLSNEFSDTTVWVLWDTIEENNKGRAENGEFYINLSEENYLRLYELLEENYLGYIEPAYFDKQVG